MKILVLIALVFGTVTAARADRSLPSGVRLIEPRQLSLEVIDEDNMSNGLRLRIDGAVAVEATLSLQSVDKVEKIRERLLKQVEDVAAKSRGMLVFDEEYLRSKLSLPVKAPGFSLPTPQAVLKMYHDAKYSVLFDADVLFDSFYSQDELDVPPAFARIRAGSISDYAAALRLLDESKVLATRLLIPRIKAALAKDAKLPIPREQWGLYDVKAEKVAVIVRKEGGLDSRSAELEIVSNGESIGEANILGSFNNARLVRAHLISKILEWHRAGHGVVFDYSQFQHSTMGRGKLINSLELEDCFYPEKDILNPPGIKASEQLAEYQVSHSVLGALSDNPPVRWGTLIATNLIERFPAQAARLLAYNLSEHRN